MAPIFRAQLAEKLFSRPLLGVLPTPVARLFTLAAKCWPARAAAPMRRRSGLNPTCGNRARTPVLIRTPPSRALLF
jgi:hypothetical protein